jgi:hypothetical protein
MDVPRRWWQKAIGESKDPDPSYVELLANLQAELLKVPDVAPHINLAVLIACHLHVDSPRTTTPIGHGKKHLSWICSSMQPSILSHTQSCINWLSALLWLQKNVAWSEKKKEKLHEMSVRSSASCLGNRERHKTS